MEDKKEILNFAEDSLDFSRVATFATFHPERNLFKF